MKIIASLLFLFLAFFGYSQVDTSLFAGDYIMKLQDNSKKGKITIYQDADIHLLQNKFVKINNDGKIDGWRIQIYNSSGAEAKEKAKEIRSKFVNKYPEVKAYTVYQPPFFKLRVGDFRTKQDAYKFYSEIMRAYPASYMVPDKIYLPQL